MLNLITYSRIVFTSSQTETFTNGKMKIKIHAYSVCYVVTFYGR